MEQLDANSFDFWLGTWDCNFDGGHAVNTITRDFGGAVITERFAIDTPQPWNGTSVSVFNAALDLWRQTWVDQDGSYWSFVGQLVDGNPAFATPDRVDVDPKFKRMVFTNIESDGFDWRWESSTDGSTWTVNWEIAYTRRR